MILFIVKRCLTVTLLSILFSHLVIAQVYASDIDFLRIRLEPHYLPPNEAGVTTGIVEDLVNEIFKDSRYHLNPVNLPQRRRDLTYNARRNDTWITITSIQNLKTFTSLYPDSSKATIPWYNFECFFISLKEHPFDPNNIEGKRLGFIYLPKTYWDNVLGSANFNYEHLPSTQGGLKMLLHGRIDAMFSFNTLINWNIHAIGETAERFHIQSCPFWKNDQFVFLINGDKDGKILKRVNQRIQQFIDNGLIDKIVKRYTPAI